jgi:hypothetical protein
MSGFGDASGKGFGSAIQMKSGNGLSVRILVWFCDLKNLQIGESSLILLKLWKKRIELEIFRTVKSHILVRNAHTFCD